MGASTLHLNNPSGNTIASRANTLSGLGQGFGGFSGTY